jgi:hypothetical protein
MPVAPKGGERDWDTRFADGLAISRARLMAVRPVCVGVLGCQAANLMLVRVIRRYEPRRPDRHPDKQFSALREILGDDVVAPA